MLWRDQEGIPKIFNKAYLKKIYMWLNSKSKSIKTWADLIVITEECHPYKAYKDFQKRKKRPPNNYLLRSKINRLCQKCKGNHKDHYWDNSPHRVTDVLKGRISKLITHSKRIDFKMQSHSNWMSKLKESRINSSTAKDKSLI